MCLFSEHSATYVALSVVLSFRLEKTEPGEDPAVVVNGLYDPCHKP